MTRPAIAAATPGPDPLASTRAMLRQVGAADRNHPRAGGRCACTCPIRGALVDAIAAAQREGMSYRQIAREVGLAPMTVRRIVKGENRP